MSTHLLPTWPILEPTSLNLHKNFANMVASSLQSVFEVEKHSWYTQEVLGEQLL